MIKITSACGGDVIKFAGDALIVVWTDGSPTDLAHRACECAMELQDSLHDEPMTENIRLSLKVS
jgi:class 3 adenylate cyclase